MQLWQELLDERGLQAISLYYDEKNECWKVDVMPKPKIVYDHTQQTFEVNLVWKELPACKSCEPLKVRKFEK